MGEGDSDMGTGEVTGKQRGSCVPFLFFLFVHIYEQSITVRIEFSISCAGGGG